jgi:hypothetical protein
VSALEFPSVLSASKTLGTEVNSARFIYVSGLFLCC